jgi:hypothetical protein
LTYTLRWEEPDPDDVETLVASPSGISASPRKSASTQGPFKSEARPALHRNGWTDGFFDKLDELLAPQA